MNTFTHEHVQKLWPHWRGDEFARFCSEALCEREGVPQEFDLVDFLCMAVDRWFAHVCPQFNESQRQYAIKHLTRRFGESPFPDYNKPMDDGEEVEGFFISVFDDRWVTWGNAGQLLDLRTFERITELPQPHVWCTILGVTPLYFRLTQDLERTDAPSSSQPA